jgi:predicted transcriptional regulator
MKSTVTVRLGDDLDRELTEVSETLGQSRSDIVREARGYLTDEDVFEDVS